MKAVIISIGDELLTGQTVDSNSANLAARLTERGIIPLAHWTVGDDIKQISDAIRRASQTYELVLVTGGLGPTADDLTRQALAEAMGTQLQLDPKSLAQIEAFFLARGRSMNETNRIQAMVPIGAKALPNPIGTAPGLSANLGLAQVFVMPGVPAEMRSMFVQEIAPLLPEGKRTTVIRQLHTFGEGESDIAARIADLMDRSANPLVGTTVRDGVVSIRVIATGPDASGADLSAETACAEIRRRLGGLVFGQDSQTLASVVGQQLRRLNQSLATAESCTGGLLGELITAEPGASDYYIGGAVAYSNRLKTEFLGVEPILLERHGAVSEQVARAMAEGARCRFSSDWALSITGIAGPAGGSADRPVGLVFLGLAGHNGTTADQLLLGGDREMVRIRSALAALNKLRIMIGL